MGNYIPTEPTRRPSISQTLAEAEQDHFLDCPNADFWIRAAAYMLDTIFLFLLITSIQKIFVALVGTQMFGDPQRLSRTFILFLSSLQIGLQGYVFYMFNIFCVTRYGGSPGKLIFGLRVIDASSGQRLSLIRTVLREIGGKILIVAATGGIDFIWSLINKNSLTLHDMASGSAVKKVHDHP